MPGSLPEFMTLNDFSIFQSDVRRKNRFFWTQETKDFLAAVASTMDSRVHQLDAGCVFFRAQIGYGERRIATNELDEFVMTAEPFAESRMSPCSDRANEGRANVKGIPIFYAALDEITAISEVRPLVSELVTVAEFETTRELRLVDCSQNFQGENYKFHQFMSHGRKKTAPDQVTLERMAWHEIDEAFSQPFSRNDDLAEYIPTQILSDLFRQQKMDGLGFKSSLRTGGHNIAIFDIGATRMVSSEVVRVSEIDLKIQVGPFYF